MLLTSYNNKILHIIKIYNKFKEKILNEKKNCKNRAITLSICKTTVTPTKGDRSSPPNLDVFSVGLICKS